MDDTQDNGKPGVLSGAAPCTPVTITDWIKAGFGPYLIPLRVHDQKKPLHEDWAHDRADHAQDDLLKWERKGHPFGLLMGDLVGFDIEGSVFAFAVRRAVESYCKKRGWDVLFRTRSGTASCMCLFRYQDMMGEKGKRLTVSANDPATGAPTTALEVYPTKRQMHMHGMHPEGMPVEWKDGIPEYEHLPILDWPDVVEMTTFVRDELAAQHPSATAKGTTAGTASSPGVGHGEQCDIEELRGLIALIPNDYDDRGRWVELMHAIFGASGGSEEGRDLAMEWSAQYEQGKEGEPERVWDSFSISTVKAGAGMLRQEAQRRNPHGYTALVMNDELPEITSDSTKDWNHRTGAKRDNLARAVMGRATATDRNISKPSPVGKLSDFMKATKNKKRPAPFIPGFAYPGIVHGIIAAPGKGKSFLSEHYVWCGLTGIDPRDPTKRLPDGGVPVLANGGEDDDTVWGQRGRGIFEGYLKNCTALDDQPFEPFLGSPMNLLDLDEKNKRIQPNITHGLHALCDVLEWLIANGYKRVVLLFDMLRHSYTGDDNARWAIDCLFRVWKAIIAECEARGLIVAIVFTHHTTKADSRKPGGDFVSAGSIGIEGNSRRITVLEEVSPTVIRTRVIKDNYGQSGQIELWEKKVVPDPAGGDTIYFDPISQTSAAFLALDLVEELHAELIVGTHGVVVAGRRAPKGAVHVRDILRTLPEGQLCDDAMVDIVVQKGCEVGAWQVGRLKRGDVDTTKGIVINSAWDRDA